MSPAVKWWGCSCPGCCRLCRMACLMTAGPDDCTPNPDVPNPGLLVCSLPRIHYISAAENRNLNFECRGLHTWLSSPAVFLPWSLPWTHVLHNPAHLYYLKKCLGLYLCGNPKSQNCTTGLCQKPASGRRYRPAVCWRCCRRSVQSPSVSYRTTHSSCAPYRSPSHQHHFLHCFHHWQSVQAQTEVLNQILTQAFFSWARLLQ